MRIVDGDKIQRFGILCLPDLPFQLRQSGKRYDLATVGRRLSNATYRVFDAVDRVEQAWLAMDLTPLVDNDGLDAEEYVGSFLRRFSDDVRARLRRHT